MKPSVIGIIRKLLCRQRRQWSQPLRYRESSSSREDRVQFGSLRRLTPFDRDYGFNRGQPIDRIYIEYFLKRCAADIKGNVLEIGEDTYTRRFGGNRVQAREILHVHANHPQATLIGDLTHAGHIPSEAFDCLIITQTLQLIYNVPAAVATLYRILKPGGVLLATVPGITQLSQDEWQETWYWSFTTQSLRRLFCDQFPAGEIAVEAYGNVLAASAFLYGLAAEELAPCELAYRDPQFEMLIAIKAVKPLVLR